MELNKQEYLTLLKLVYLGNWTIEATEEEVDENSIYNKLEQKILSMADKYESSENVSLDEESNSYEYTEEFEEKSGLFDTIEDYNEEIFWDELIARFARKEFADKFSKKIDKMSEEEQNEEINLLTEKYAEYFEKNDINKLKL